MSISHTMLLRWGLLLSSMTGGSMLIFCFGPLQYDPGCPAGPEKDNGDLFQDHQIRLGLQRLGQDNR